MMIRLRTLGACAIQVGETTIGPEAERLFAVLLYLTTERGRRTPRRAVQDLLWPEASEEHGRHNLRQVIYKLRQYGVELGGGARDVQLYQDQIVHDPFAVLSGEAAVAGDALLGGEIGEYLAGYSPTFSGPYAAWVEAQRAYSHARVARVAVAATLERRARGRWEEVERLAGICLRYDPLNEEATLALAEATAMAGSKTRALAILDQYIVELGDSTSIQLPATLLRRRIAERLPEPAYTVPSEACFAGRDESLRYLHELFGHGRAGRGQACMVVGEPGVGKSRLASEFVRVATLQGALTFRMGSQPRDAARPLSLFVDWVPGLLKLPGALGCSPRAMGYLKRIIEFDADAAGPTHDGRDAEYLYANVRRSVLDMLDAIVAERTLLLVIEDVHWSDAASWDVLRDLIAWCAGRRVLVVLTARIAHVPGSPLEQLPLRLHHIGPLAADAATQLLDALVAERQRQLSEAQHGWLLRSASGNPLFLRELAIHWLETGREADVPPSLAALLRERLARLSPLALRVFQTCAVMGAHATFERLETVLEYKRHAVLDALQELEAAGLLGAGGGGVHCRHELVSEAAVSALADSARAFLHRQAALALEPAVLASVPGDASLLWACAAHWEAAGEAPRAWGIANACGGYLLEVGRPADAVAIYERSASYAESAEQMMESRRGLAAALMHLGHWDRARDLLLVIIESTGQEHRPPRSTAKQEAELDLLHAELQLGGDVDELQRRSKALLVDRTATSRYRVKAAVTAVALADHACAVDEIREVHRLTQDALQNTDVDAAHRATINMIYHVSCGDLDKATDASEALLEARRASGSPADIVHALRCAARVARYSGNWSAATDYLHDAVALAERHRFATQAIRACGMLAEQAFCRLDFYASADWHARAVGWARSTEDRLLQAINDVFAAKLALAHGDITNARAHLESPRIQSLANTLYGGRIDALAVRLHADVASGGLTTTRELLPTFEAVFSKLLPFGDLDYAAVVRYLCTTDDEPGGHQRLVAYATVQRRERGRLSALLEATLDRRASPFASIKS